VDHTGNYPTSVQTHVNINVLSYNEAQWLNGNYLGAFGDAIGTAGASSPLGQYLSAGLSILGIGIETIPAQEGDIEKTTTEIHGTRVKQVTKYYKKNTHELYYTKDWREFVMPAGTLYKIGNPIKSKDGINRHIWKQYLA